MPLISCSFSATQKATAIARRISLKRLGQIVVFFFGAFLAKELLFKTYSRYITTEGNVGSFKLQRATINEIPESPTSQNCSYKSTGHTGNDTYDGPVEFVLYRSIGNDLPPRHALGQSYNNIEFILKHEPDLPGLEKRWILNHIFNTTEKKRIIRLLDANKQHYEVLDINFEIVEKIPINHEGFNEHDVMRRTAKRGDTLMEKVQYRSALIDHIYRNKNIYVINNNGGRNQALQSGIKAGFKWILPWDGNCFLSKSAWIEMRETVKAHSAHKYFHVPMDRLVNNEVVLDPSYCPNAVEEPQLIFRNDAKEKFSLNQRYGRRPKVDLLLRLGVPGPWDEYIKASRPYYEEATNYTVSMDVTGEVGKDGEIRGVGVPASGWVARLYSGNGDQEVSTKDSAVRRKLARCIGVAFLLGQVDAYAAEKIHSLSKNTLTIYNETVMMAERDAYEHAPEANKDLVKLIKKLEEYANESMAIPIVAKKLFLGKPIPVSFKVYDKPEEIIPPARLGPFFRNTTCLALGWFYTRRTEFSAKASMLISSFFLEKYTRVSPEEVVNSMFYIDEKSYKEEGWDPKLNVVGSIEMKDLYYFLDAVRLLNRSGLFSKAEMNKIEEWFSEYNDLVLSRAQGDMVGFLGAKDGFEYRATGPRGVYYDLQLASTAAFSGNWTLFMHYAKHAKGRMTGQFASRAQPIPYSNNTFIGTMRLDRRTNTIRDNAFIIKQLNAWFLLARVSQMGGVDLVSFQHVDALRPLLRTATLFTIPGFESQYLIEMKALNNSLKNRTITTMKEIQATLTPEMKGGLLLSYYLALRAWPDLKEKQDPTAIPTELYKASPLANEKLGLHPFWNLGLTDQYLVSGSR